MMLQGHQGKRARWKVRVFIEAELAGPMRPERDTPFAYWTRNSIGKSCNYRQEAVVMALLDTGLTER
jgi:hypothetical protein